jgi:hypothetical protein
MHAPESYSRTEEIAHALTAALGVAAMLLGIPWLVMKAAENGGVWRVIGAVAFGCGGLMMFATSTLYHAARLPERKAWLRRLDHSAIYLLIAGTYTPFTIGVIRGSLGWSLFGIVWGLALLGVVAKLSGGNAAHPGALDAALRGDRMGWRRRLQAALAQPHADAIRVDGGGRPLLHRRRALLPMEAPAVRACGVARVRTSRRRLPLRRDIEPVERARRLSGG